MVFLFTSFDFFPVIFQKNCQEKMRWICHENAISNIVYVASISFL